MPVPPLIARVRALFRRDGIAADIREEMDFHLEMRAEELRRSGLTPEEAKRAAQRRFGNVAVMQERGYDVRGGGTVETVIQDIRYALRLLTRQRAFSVVTIARSRSRWVSPRRCSVSSMQRYFGRFRSRIQSRSCLSPCARTSTADRTMQRRRSPTCADGRVPASSHQSQRGMICLGAASSTIRSRRV
jgi:hypothetical protein